MKNIIKQIGSLCVIIAFFNACSDGFLDVKPKGTDMESNYYKNRQEAFNGVVAVYDALGSYTTKVIAMNAGTDDHYAGGGSSTDWIEVQVVSNYSMSPAQGPQEELWDRNYTGIFRANVLLEKLPGVLMDEAEKRRFVAEAKFLRAVFYFDLIRLFKNIPLIMEPVPANQMYDVVQALPAEVYAAMEKDLNEAIPDLPRTIPVDTEGGRATQGAGKSLLGKVLLQQEKFLQAAEQFKEVNGDIPGNVSQYGYKLLSNYGDLFVIKNKFNSESIFEICHTNTSGGGWDDPNEGNLICVILGPRVYTKLKDNAPDYMSGWSFLPLTVDLFNTIKNDPRCPYTVANLDSLERNGIATYEKGYMNTGYFLEKFVGRMSDRPNGMPGEPDMNFPQNMYEIRLADTYLLEAEALVRGNGDINRAAGLLNAVRTRVGLPPVAATFENIKRERRLELVGEGHRWFDLVRWGDAATVLKDRGFVAGKHEILPIPLLELENTKLEQSKEWGGTK